MSGPASAVYLVLTMKKVIFFDGDGTLWYPKTTKRTRKPHWVYLDESIADPVGEFIITPHAKDVLETLGSKGIKRVLLSTSPLSEEEAIMQRIEVLQHIDIHHLLDDIQVAPDRQDGKGLMITKLLKQSGLKPEDALMVGDSYKWDYDAAQNVGVDAALLDSDYERDLAKQMGVTNLIKDLRGVLALIQ